MLGAMLQKQARGQANDESACSRSQHSAQAITSATRLRPCVLGIGFAVSFVVAYGIGGVVYELGEAEGIYAICDLQDYFGGGGFVFCFADGMRRRGRELNAETQRAQRREPKSTAKNGCAT